MADGLMFFAEDIFGTQFAIAGGAVLSFDPETGETSPAAGSVEEWAAAILQDHEFLTGHPVARRWQEAHGPLAIGDRLVPKRPFVLGGEYEVANLVAMDAVKGMRFRGDLAVQIRDLPDGSAVVIRITD